MKASRALSSLGLFLVSKSDEGSDECSILGRRRASFPNAALNDLLATRDAVDQRIAKTGL
jgi:hypothetical protein